MKRYTLSLKCIEPMWRSGITLMATGIANPISFFSYLQQEKDTLAVFADHHHFTKSEIEAVDEKANGRIIVTTEKDYVRLKKHSMKSKH